ncbi:TBC domain-containing protein [Loa loa]|uniref:TBC domain-containing protein n=1 Tax=Loa loa TaxID=7209 RepID=A0A1S0U0D1_LOALO|nr:TBC domain-containing protein [Loa loa]EFO23216.2 TBC domain-containing protein [Loa loa]
MSHNWIQQSAIPGSVRPVYGAQYPPLTEYDDFANNAGRIGSSDSQHSNSGAKFQNYVDSVSDAWDVSVTLDERAACTSAAKVLERHASLAARDLIMPPVNPVPSRNSKIQAMQRLAIQKEPIPGTAVPTGSSGVHLSINLYPRLPEISVEYGKVLSSSALVDPMMAHDSSTAQEGHTLALQRDHARFDRLRAQLGVHTGPSSSPKNVTQSLKTVDIDLEQLRKDCWMGIPHKLRPTIWRILLGYLPTNFERREVTLARKREEYWRYVEQYFHTRYDEQHQDTFRQIHIDIPRMCPLIPLFQQKVVQEGINDLVTPFFVVFLSEFISDDTEVGTYDVSQLPREQIEIVEADSFWCVTALLDTIQDNYTFAQPGIQRKVSQLRHLMSRVDKQLHRHLEAHGVEYLQFAFRWMNNVLMREIPLRATIRLWDTFLSERDGFSQFHGYVCAAFLRMWSKQLQAEKDFQGIMLLLQNLPTHSWGDQQICELTADAFSLMALFDGAKNHLAQDMNT